MFTPLLALAASSMPASCEARLLDYRKWRPARHQKWDLTLRRGGGAISLFGAEHLRDPANPQFGRIATGFTAASPTLVFFEGPDRGTADRAEAAITASGESGYLRYLAKAGGIAARSLEPSPGEQAAALARSFSGDQVILFFVLREAARLRDREGKSGAALDASIATLVARIGPLAAKAGIATTIVDLPSLAAASAREWPGRDWHALPGGWFDPLARDPAAGFLPKANAADSDYRNRHMARLFAEAVSKGERVFVVVGRNHVPIIAPALRCAIG